MRPESVSKLCNGPSLEPQRNGRSSLMNLQSERELEVTREKLPLLEECYEQDRREPDGDAHVQELTLRSLKRMINQLREEIVRFESRSVVTTRKYVATRSTRA